MTDKNGWIKLHRKLLNHWTYEDPEMLKLWITLLTKASHKNHIQKVGYQLVELKPGQLIFGRKKMAKQTDISPSKIYRMIRLLAEDEMIKYDIESYNKFSIITILNWSKYQIKQQNEQVKTPTGQGKQEDSKQQNEQEVNSKRTAPEQVANTNKNVKNGNNVKETYIHGGEQKIKISEAMEKYWPGTINPNQFRQLQSYNEDLPKNLIIEAIKRSKGKGSPFHYCKSILNNWVNEGAQSLKDIEELDQQHEKNQITDFERRRKIQEDKKRMRSF